MSNIKNYVLSFTTLFYTKKGYVLMFNRHQNVSNEKDIPVEFLPWSRYDALVMRDMKLGTKVKRATGVMQTTSADYSTVFEGDSADLEKGTTFYLTNLNKEMNESIVTFDGDMVRHDLGDTPKDFYVRLGEILEQVNTKVVRDVAEPIKDSLANTFSEGYEVKDILGLLNMVGDDSTLELLKLLPHYGYNQATELVDLLFKEGSKEDSTERLMTIQYGERFVDMAKANYLKTIFESLMDVVTSTTRPMSDATLIELDKTNRTEGLSMFGLLDMFDGAHVVKVGVIDESVGTSNLLKADLLQFYGSVSPIHIYGADLDKATDSKELPKYIDYSGTSEAVVFRYSNDAETHTNADKKDTAVIADNDSIVSGRSNPKLGEVEELISTPDQLKIYGDIDNSTPSTLSTNREGDIVEFIDSLPKSVLVSDGVELITDASSVTRGGGLTLTITKSNTKVYYTDHDDLMETENSNTQYGKIDGGFDYLSTWVKGNVEELMELGSTYSSAMAELNDMNRSTMLGVGEGYITTITSADVTAQTDVELEWGDLAGNASILEVEIERQDRLDIVERVIDAVRESYSMVNTVDSILDVVTHSFSSPEYVEKIQDVTIDGEQEYNRKEQIPDLVIDGLGYANILEITSDTELISEEVVTRNEVLVEVEENYIESGGVGESLLNVQLANEYVATHLDVDFEVSVDGAESSKYINTTLDLLVQNAEEGKLYLSDGEVTMNFSSESTITVKDEDVYLVNPSEGALDNSSVYVMLNNSEFGEDVETVKDVTITGTYLAESASSMDVNLLYTYETVSNGQSYDVSLSNVEVSIGIPDDDYVELSSSDVGNNVLGFDVVLSFPEGGVNESTFDVFLASGEGGQAGTHTNDVELSVTDLGLNGTEQDVYISTVDLAEGYNESEVELSRQDYANTKDLSDVALLDYTDLANIGVGYEVVLSGTELSDVGNNYHDVELDSGDTAESSTTQDIKLVGTDLADINETVDVTLDGGDTANTTNDYEVEIDKYSVATPSNTFHDVVVDGYAYADRAVTKLLNIYEEEEVIKKSSTIMVVDDGELGNKKSSRGISINESDQSERQSTKNINIIGDDEGQRYKTLDTFIEENQEGDRHRDFTIDINDQSEGIGLLPKEPPWEEPQEPSKIWLTMGKPFPAWNGWNPKKTR